MRRSARPRQHLVGMRHRRGPLSAAAGCRAGCQGSHWGAAAKLGKKAFRKPWSPLERRTLSGGTRCSGWAAQHACWTDSSAAGWYERSCSPCVGRQARRCCRQLRSQCLVGCDHQHACGQALGIRGSPGVDPPLHGPKQACSTCVDLLRVAHDAAQARTGKQVVNVLHHNGVDVQVDDCRRRSPGQRAAAKAPAGPSTAGAHCGRTGSC